MKLLKNSIPLLTAAFAICPQALAVTLLFDNATTFDANFPVATRSFAGTSTATLLTSPNRVSLLSQNNVASASRAVISTATGFFSDFNFISGAKSVTFNNPAMSFTSGTSFISYLGIANQTDQIQNATGALYFQIERTNSNGTLLSLVQRQSSTTTALESWDINTLYDSANQRYVFDNLQFTASSTAWSVTGLGIGAGANPNLNITGSGTFATAFDSTNWGSSTDFYLTLQSRQTANNATRFTDLQVQSVTAIPEPSTGILILGSVGLALLLRRKRLSL